MTKNIHRILLILLFSLFSIVIILSLLAELQFDAAKQLDNNRDWQQAYAGYSLAARLNPLNSKYLYALGEFLEKSSIIQRDKFPWLNRAKEAYQKALELNPRNADYAVALGRLELGIDKKNLPVALNYFRLALKNDPNGFNTSSDICYSLLKVWPYLDIDGKELVIERLRYVLKIRPWYAEGIYSYISKTSKDYDILKKIRPKDTPEEKRKKLKRIEQVRRNGSSKSWQGKSRSGDNAYENGNMYWIGTVDRLISVQSGQPTIIIQAKGEPTDNVWPYMIVELDGEVIGEVFVENSDWKEYSFKANTTGGLKVLSVTFANDGGNLTEDRNLFVGEVKIVVD